MKKLFISAFLFINLQTFSQEYKDTTFSVKEFTCQCKYSNNIEDVEDENKIFDLVEQRASYPGGENEWNKFLENNLNIDFKGKKHKFWVQFVIKKDGDLSAFRLLGKVKNQKYEEVLRVLKLSGKWFPAVQNGYCVKSYFRLMFEF